MRATAPERAHLTARVDRDVLEQLERIARTNDRSMSAEVRTALRAHVERAHDVLTSAEARQPSPAAKAGA
jgi:predicted transcriptional regulator